MDFFSKDFIKDYFRRNRKLFLISLIIFIISFLIGVLASLAITGNNHGLISNAIFSGKSNISLDNLFVDTSELFFHNLYVDILTLIFGLLFSIVSLGLFCMNAFLIGMPFGQDFLFAFFSIVPHSIFEYTASLFALVGAFLFTTIEIDIIKSFWDKNKSVGDVIAEDRIKLKDILLSVIFMVILLVIAAIIEGNITPRIVFWFFS
jgi:uncharacterized membrane protein SpoIIM required for sporulation